MHTGKENGQLMFERLKLSDSFQGKVFRERDPKMSTQVCS